MQSQCYCLEGVTTVSTLDRLLVPPKAGQLGKETASDVLSERIVVGTPQAAKQEASAKRDGTLNDRHSERSRELGRMLTQSARNRSVEPRDTQNKDCGPISTQGPDEMTLE